MRRSDEARFYYLQELRFGTFENVWHARSRRTMTLPAGGAATTRPGCTSRCPLAEGLTEYEAYFAFGEHHQGGPGIVHGGLVAGALDEAVGLLATWYAFPAVTARIFVRYRRPVPINTELLIRAWLDEARGRRLHVDAAIGDGDERFAECKAALLHVPLEHFLAHSRGPRSSRALGSGAREHLVDPAEARREQRCRARAVERDVRRPVGRRPGGFEPRGIGAEQHGEVEPGDVVGPADVERPRHRQREQLEQRGSEVADVDAASGSRRRRSDGCRARAAPAGRARRRRRSARCGRSSPPGAPRRRAAPPRPSSGRTS